MNIIQKHLRFLFSFGLFCVIIPMIIEKTSFSSENRFTMEQHPPFSYYEVIEQRNIFRPKTEEDSLAKEQNPDTRPLPDQVASGVDDYVLTGIVKLRGKYKATIKDKTMITGHYVEAGDQVGQFNVTDIQQDRVLLERDGKTYELKIKTLTSPLSKKALMENKGSQTETSSPESPPVSDDQTNYRTNLSESLRMGIPNAQKN